MNKEFFKRILSSAILIPVVLLFIIKGSTLFNLFILLCFIIASYEWHMMSKKKTYKIIGFAFLFMSFYTVYELRAMTEYFYYFLSIILICILTDIGGYLFGKTLKGPKLTKISPKKTYAGLFGGYLMSVLFMNFFLNSSYIFINPVEMTLDNLIFILLISTISQTGDLVVSYFKRLVQIKDTGNIIPGHGGLLDRIDGMIFAFPFSYILIKINILQNLI